MTASPALMPQPLSVARGHGHIDLGPRSGVPVSGDADLIAVLNGLAARTRGIHFTAVDAGDAAVELAVGEFADVAALPTPRGMSPTGDELDERYVLTAAAGRVVVRARRRAGLVRAVTTLLQLIEVGDRVAIAEVTVADAPRYAWRGLSLDVARHYFAAGEIERVVDLLAWHRMNVLHLHLSDSQAWRLALEDYPALTADTPSYTPAQLRDLDAYAAARGVTLIGELDMPGHTQSVLAACPELAGAAERPHPAIAYLDPDHAPAVTFARHALTTLADTISSPFLHIGGDEAFGMPAEAYGRFVRILADHMHALGRRVVGWQETTRADALRPDDIAQLWVSDRDAFDAERMKAKTDAVHHPLIDLVAETFAHAPGDIDRAVAADVPVLISSSFPLYIDRPYAEAAAPGEPAERAGRVGFTDYPPEPMTTLEQWDPDAHAARLPDGARVAGIEAALWCETVSSFDDAAFLLLPRLAIIAQRTWNPVDDNGNASRLAAHEPIWDALGFGAHFRPAAAPGRSTPPGVTAASTQERS